MPDTSEHTPSALDEWAGEFALDSVGEGGRTRVSSRVARALKRYSAGRSSREAAKGAAKVERELAWLGEEWHNLHIVEVGTTRSEIDHILIGPAGVIVLDVERHTNAKVRVDDSRLTVDEEPRNYVRKGRGEVERVQRLLSKACGQPITAAAAIAFVDVDELIVKHMPTDVHITTSRRLLVWLKELPETVDPETVELIYRSALLEATWRAGDTSV